MTISSFSVYDSGNSYFGRSPIPWANPSRSTGKKYRQSQAGAGTDSAVPAETFMMDAAIVPGQVASESAIARVQSKVRLLELIRRLGKDISAQNDLGIIAPISEATTEAAIALFKALPDSVVIPKISPEGEGGLTAVWDSQEAPVILVIEDWKLHLVTAATTRHARYFDDLLFDGEKVPSELVEALPEY